LPPCVAVADFVPSSGWRRVYLWGLRLFFALSTGNWVRQLWDWEAFWQEQGYQTQESQALGYGLVRVLKMTRRDGVR
jgi:hypothetical protein